ncbi:MAG: LVIVD repeat-containing protein [Sediminibacterium sp.]
MKTQYYCLLAILIFFTGCMKDTVEESYSFYRPVYQTKDEVKAGIRNASSTAIENPGKIVLLGNYLFLNDVDKGIHIIDLADITKPQKIGFIHIPGCMDMAVNGTTLYADCYTDLVTIDIADPHQVKVKQFLNGVFPHRYYGSFIADTSQVIQKWVKVDTVIRRDYPGPVRGNNFEFNSRGLMLFSSFRSNTGAFAGTAATGIAGSTARFGQQQQRLYTVSHDDLKVFNVTVPDAPVYVKEIALNRGDIETIFPYQQNLFIGAQTGMYIYNASNPDNPQPLGQFVHTRACDPVIAEGDYAFVTLKGGGLCGGFNNQLDVLNIKNLQSPQLIKSYPLAGPRGLSKDGDLLLICDGTSGLKIFDANNVSAIKPIKTIVGFDAVDVIAYQGVAIVVATDGIYLVDYQTPVDAKLVSKIQVSKN